VYASSTTGVKKSAVTTTADRRVQLGRKVLDPPGQARVDWEVVQDIANRLGLGWSYTSARKIFDEIVAVTPSYTNLSYDNLGLTGKLYPNPDPEHSDGIVVMFDERFNTDDGLAHLVPAVWLPAKKLPDDQYPFVLNTGRLLEHWHTGTMTRRSYALDTIAPRAEVYLNPEDAAGLGIADGSMARVSSRRGTIVLAVRVSHRDARGNCFIPFHFREAAATLLTIDEIDPTGKIPEFKFYAVPRRGRRRNGLTRAEAGLMAKAQAPLPGAEGRQDAATEWICKPPAIDLRRRRSAAGWSPTAISAQVQGARPLSRVALATQSPQGPARAVSRRGRRQSLPAASDDDGAAVP
jgi:predicted molibdopterin-dependent oxidoreductase YjgC